MTRVVPDGDGERWRGEVDRLLAEHERRLNTINGATERLAARFEQHNEEAGRRHEQVSGRVSTVNFTLRLVAGVVVLVAVPTLAILVDLALSH